ncbi:ATP synthase subunit delta [Candidatus Profftia lariciata]|uniref:F0F1 ATP synthase subunit delta n=1 Tax=Candidatus Profftia lariciata TaxID=1987921 RepID=UPI001D00AB2A|nr:F0F1 ATP synthase subunit delta [Candidatus Profftia lariciata]UDG81774.1 ATP synthase subunit delta [Candidatus Profftia lariciata]
MSKFITMARPYAKAAFDFAVENHSLDHWQYMLTFCAEVARRKNIIQILTGMLTIEKKLNLFIQLCGDQIDTFGHNFIKIMSENQRLLLLPEVLQQFNELRNILENKIHVEVTSVINLSKEQLNKIKTSMEIRMSRKVILNCTIDKSIIAGMIIRVGDLVIDGSIRHRLKCLAGALQS